MEGNLDAAAVSAGAGQLSPDGRWRWTGRDWVPAVPLATPWRWPELKLRRAADTRALLAAVFVGLTFDLAMQSGAIGVGVSAWILLTVGALTASRRLSTRSAVGASLIAVAVAPWFGLRTSQWLLIPDAAVVAVAVGGAVLLSVQGSAWNFPLRSSAERTAQLLLHMSAAPGFLVKPLSSLLSKLDRGKRSTAAAGLRGLLIALPVVVMLGVLLSSADPIFASFFNIQWDVASVAGHISWAAVGTLMMAGLLRGASSEPVVALDTPGVKLGATEGLTVMVCLVALFGAFAVAQVIGLVGAGAQTLHASGITYSDYARSGFFQLLWVAGLTAIVLVTLRNLLTALQGTRRRAFVLLTEVAIVLTLAIVAVAFERLALYESAYGLTMLRLYCQVFAVWVAIVFVAIGIAVWRRSKNQWLYPAGFLAGAVIVLALNVVNPEAAVVRWNVARAAAVTVDTSYLAQLSDDALPELQGLAGRFNAGQRTNLRSAVCSQAPVRRTGTGYNAAADAAAAARERLCH